MSGALLHPVYGFSDGCGRLEPLAVFFDCWDAIDFAMHPQRHGFEARNVYCAEPKRDRRTSGYRFVPKPRHDRVLARAA